MNTDQLDGLTDAEISEPFAVEYLGWRFKENSEELRPNAWIDPQGHAYYNEPYYPPFATSSDAVLPYATPRFGCGKMEGGGWMASAHTASGDILTAKAPTFARAACIALLRAKRAEKGQP